MNALGHWKAPEYDCGDCSAVFSVESALRDHEVTRHFYCDDCDKHFQNYNNIKMASPLSRS